MGVVFIKTIHKKHGFTLVELIVVLSILAILATLLIPSLTGYIEKAKRQAQKQIKMEEKHIPEDIDYEDVKNLALEAKQKLSEIRPLTIGQASRISGINPADISVLLIYLKQKYNGE